MVPDLRSSRGESRAGFSWWEAWGPAIGIGEGARQGVAPPPKKVLIFRANIM